MQDSPSDRMRGDEVGSSRPTVRGAMMPLDEQPTVISKPNDLLRLTTRPMELARELEGEQLGHYRLDEFVGGGGMGAVFRGYDLELNRTVAVKVVPHKADDQDTFRRFKNEAQSAARLDHDRIARVFNVGSDKNWHYIVFEFIEGVNIRDLVQHKGPLSLEEALLYTRQVAEGLEHACTRDVVHRDIKPSNVLVMQDGTAKVVDFGLARLHQGESASEDLTQSGMMFGTFDYIPPEQARDPRDTDVRSDLYSLGCTLYYMLVGEPPFAAGTMLQKLLRHSSEAPDRVEMHRPDLPTSIGDIVDRLLAKQQADRFQSPGELIQALDDVAREIGLRLSTAAPVMPVIRAPERPWARQVAWVAPVAALILIAAALEWRMPHQPMAEAHDVRLLSPLPIAEAPKVEAVTPAVPPVPEPAPTPDPSEPSPPPVLTEQDLSAGEASAGDEEFVLGPPRDLLEIVAVAAPVDPHRIVVQPDNQPVDAPRGVARVASLEEAIRRVNESATLNQIELRFNGAMTVSQLQFASSRTIRITAPEGYQPRLAFTPTADSHSMFNVLAGHLEVESLQLELSLPAIFPSVGSALFTLEQDAEQLTLKRCLLTVNSDTSRASFVQVIRSARSEMPAESPKPERMAPFATFEQCVARGHASLLHSPKGAPVRGRFNRSLLATSSCVVEASGGMAGDARMAAHVELEMQKSTIFAKAGLAEVTMEDGTLPELEIILNDCVVSCPGPDDVGSPLITHFGVMERAKAVDATRVLGANNLIAEHSLNHFVPAAVVSKDGWDFSVRAIRADGPQWLELPTNVPTSQRVPAHFILTERDAELDVGADMMELQAIMGASTNAETAAQ
ncbi:MAG: serine/threonine protein kinase [Planctomycetales bacterium]|nr:serine/threonine protein kinase [Planctomycetales bacterium]